MRIVNEWLGNIYHIKECSIITYTKERTYKENNETSLKLLLHDSESTVEESKFSGGKIFRGLWNMNNII